jgi:hypothetical protein
LRVFEGRIACRRCLGLEYASQHPNPNGALHAAARLRRQIGGSGSLLEPLPPRPRAPAAAAEYDLAVARIAALEWAAVGQLRGFTDSLDNLVRRKYARRTK